MITKEQTKEHNVSVHLWDINIRPIRLSLWKSINILRRFNCFLRHKLSLMITIKKIRRTNNERTVLFYLWEIYFPINGSSLLIKYLLWGIKLRCGYYRNTTSNLDINEVILGHNRTQMEPAVIVYKNYVTFPSLHFLWWRKKEVYSISFL